MKKNLLLKTLAITLLMIGSAATSLFAQTTPLPDACNTGGSYLIFNGDSSQYVQLNPNAEYNNNFLNALDDTATIQCDVYLTKDTANEYIFSAAGRSGTGTPTYGNENYFIALAACDNTLYPRFFLTTDSFAHVYTVTGPNILDTGVWHHIVITYDSTSVTDSGVLTMYIDGDSVASSNTVGGVIQHPDNFSTLDSAFLGRSVFNPSDPYLYGYLDEFRAADTVEYYGPSYTVADTQLKADNHTIVLYNFNDGFAETAGNPVQTAIDSSGNNFTAILGQNETDTVYDPKWAQCEVLPVSLSEFTGQVVKGGIQLIWNTASEQNSDYFSIERSEDGSTFQEIGSVKAAGTTSANHSYLYNDLDPLPGMNYYRLKQVDLDGSFIYSRVIGINYLANAAAFKVYPTLTTGNINVTLPSPGQVIIVNMMGSEVQRVNVTNTNQQINVSNLPAGQYILKVVGTNNSTMFIKQ
jgi:Concanavalin A-like lectin/glucanases superfamily/Secretion system C-terminal sorting domain